jgi:hypothetical protein
MALSPQAHTPQWHFWVRLSGLTGVLILAAGLVIVAAGALVAGIILAVLGGVLAGLALLVELKGAVGMALSQRGAAGSNALIQVLLAALLFVGVNAFSFFHYSRWDWTRDREFTIPADLREQLAELRSDEPTRIVVYQRQSASGQLAGPGSAPDNYDAAADRKIVEKVKDLVEQFQELGPRFHVELLDKSDESFEERFSLLQRETPKLAQAIEAAPESTIFFYAQDKVQRLAFHDIYQLDKKASQQANGGRGNLVLRFQGAAPFARRVLNLDERQPRIAVGVIHEILGLESREEFGMGGAKKALAARGIASRDLILKKWQRGGLPTPDVLTPDEFKYERLEIRLASLDQSIKGLKEQLRVYEKQRDEWASRPAAELAKKYALVLLLGGPEAMDKREVEAQRRQGRPVREAPITDGPRGTRSQYVAYLNEDWLPLVRENLEHDQKEQAKAAAEQSKLNVEGLEETRRLGDLRARFNRLLADCDLLIIPRWTLFNAAAGRVLAPNWLYHLDAAQVEAIKDFLKSGKPVLFCLSPSNEPPEEPPPPGVERLDRVELLLEDLGLRLPRQTILYDVESESLAEQQAGLLLRGPQVEVPPVRFSWKLNKELPRGLAGPADFLARPGHNSIRTSLDLAARAVGKKGSLDLRLPNPRPVYYEPFGEKRPDPDAVFMVTSTDCWNEAKPFPGENYTPKYERPKANSPTRGTLEEQRRGPFPIGVSVQTELPPTWYEGKGPAVPAKVRVGVIGHGGVFSGSSLNAAQERVLLDTCNWLMGRDDLLARSGSTWEYPRVELADTGSALWHWGTFLGLPLLFIYLGLVVLMVRRMR